MAITVARFIDVADGVQPGQFTVGDHVSIDSLPDLDPIYKQLLDDPVTAIVSVVGGDGRSNLTPVWFDYEGDLVLLNLATHRKKVEWLGTIPELSYILMNPANPYHWLSIKCTVAKVIPEEDPVEGRRVIEQLNKIYTKYTGDTNRTRCGTRPSTNGGCSTSLRSTGSRRSGGPERMGWPSVAVVGGSLGGLTAALVLADAGCDVIVYERSPSALQARGAGIAVLDETVRWFAEKTATDPDELCSSTGFIRFLHPSGAVVHNQAHRYRFSSWNTMYRALLAGLPAGRYLLDREMTSFKPSSGGVELAMRTGERVHTDLLVAADGIGSTTRAALMPDVSPQYSGYVAWRGTIPEADLRPPTFVELSDAITYQVLPDRGSGSSHVLVYPIPGPDGALEPGRRLMNFVWYRNVPRSDLDHLMTDRAGRPRAVSLPPGAVRDEFIEGFGATPSRNSRRSSRRS